MFSCCLSFHIDQRFFKMHGFAGNIAGSSAQSSRMRAFVDAANNHMIGLGQGSVAFFLSGSLAEYRDADLHRFLRRVHQVCRETDPSLTETPSIHDLLTENGGLVCHYFDHKTRFFHEEVLKCVLGCEKYFIKYEYAPSRGAMHFHSLVWSSKFEPLLDAETVDARQVQGALVKKAGFVLSPREANLPGCNAETLEDVGKKSLERNFMDLKNTPGGFKTQHAGLMHAVMQHVCNGYCMRKRGKPCKNCRFGYPQQQQDQPEVKRNKLKFSRSAADSRFLVHSRPLLLFWGCNTDIQPCLGKDVVAMSNYLSSYCTKDEVSMSSMRAEFNRVIREGGSEISTASKYFMRVLGKSLRRQIHSVCPSVCPYVSLCLPMMSS